MQKKRTSLESIRDYLEVLSHKDLLQTTILLKANFSQEMYKKYTKYLLNNKAIEIKGNKISITPHGRFLFDRINKIVNEHNILTDEIIGKALQGSG